MATTHSSPYERANFFETRAGLAKNVLAALLAGIQNDESPVLESVVCETIMAAITLLEEN